MNKLFKKIKLYVHSIKHNITDDFVFIHINKTGGSSIEKALDIPFEHKTALEKISEIGKKNWDKKFTFCVVRNPWDKVVSHYHYRIKTNQTNLKNNPVDFKEWVKLTYGSQDPIYYDKPKMFMSQTNWIIDEDSKIIIDEIIRFENLSGDFTTVAKKLGKNTSLPHTKKSKHKNYKEYYDEQTMEIISTWFKDDIENFNYSF